MLFDLIRKRKGLFKDSPLFGSAWASRVLFEGVRIGEDGRLVQTDIISLPGVGDFKLSFS